MITYIIESKTSNLYKIGRTRNLQKRLQMIKGSISYENLVVYRTFDCDVEYALHKHFAPYRVVGEWFKLNDSLIDSIDIESIMTCQLNKIKSSSDVNSVSYFFDIIMSLSAKGQALFRTLMLEVEQTKEDTVMLSFSRFLACNPSYTSNASYYNAIRELEDKDVIVYNRDSDSYKLLHSFKIKSNTIPPPIMKGVI